MSYGHNSPERVNGHPKPIGDNRPDIKDGHNSPKSVDERPKSIGGNDTILARTFIQKRDDPKPIGGNNTILARTFVHKEDDPKPIGGNNTILARTFVCKGDDPKPIGGKSKARYKFQTIVTNIETAIDNTILARTFVCKGDDPKPIGGKSKARYKFQTIATITEAAIDNFILARTFVCKGDDPKTIGDKSRSEQESEAVNIVVPRINPDDIREMMNEHDFEPCAKEVADWDECDESPPNCFDDTEESSTQLGGIQIKFDTAETSGKRVAVTEESNMEMGGVLFLVLLHTDSGVSKNDICTQSTGNDILMKSKDIIKESNNNRPTLQSELGRVTEAQAELSSSDVNVDPKETCAEIVTGVFTMNNC